MPRPYNLTFDLLALKVVSESRVMWATSVPIFIVFLGLSVHDLGPMYATDRQTSDAHRRFMPPLWERGHNNTNSMSKSNKTNWCRAIHRKWMRGACPWRWYSVKSSPKYAKELVPRCCVYVRDNADKELTDIWIWYVHFHSLEVASSLFARWRVCARWTRAIARHPSRTFFGRDVASG